MKEKFSRKRVVMCIATFIGLIGLISASVYLKSVADYQKSVRETVIKEVDFSTIPDGVYVGEYDVNFIYAKVEVTVQNGVIPPKPLRSKYCYLPYKADRSPLCTIPETALRLRRL